MERIYRNFDPKHGLTLKAFLMDCGRGQMGVVSAAELVVSGRHGLYRLFIDMPSLFDDVIRLLYKAGYTHLEDLFDRMVFEKGLAGDMQVVTMPFNEMYINIPVTQCLRPLKSCLSYGYARANSTDRADCRGHIGCMELFMQLRLMTPRASILSRGVSSGRLRFVIWAINRGCPLTSHAYVNACRNFDLSMVMFLYEQGCPIDGSVKRAAIFYDAAEIVDWLVKIGA